MLRLRACNRSDLLCKICFRPGVRTDANGLSPDCGVKPGTLLRDKSGGLLGRIHAQVMVALARLIGVKLGSARHLPPDEGQYRVTVRCNWKVAATWSVID